MTFNQLYTRFTNVSRNTATSPVNNETLGKAFINETEAIVLATYEWPFLETTANLTSVASQEGYELPISARNNQITAVRLEESSTVIYTAQIVESYRFWEQLQSYATAASDVLRYVYVQDEQLLCYPKPASASKTIRVRYRLIHKDMTQADYSTGTITSIANGATTVTGATTAWTAGMAQANGHIRFTNVAAAGGGDGYWYEISSITSTTVLELVKKYAGTSIAAATATYTIGEMPLIPESHHSLLEYRPLARYFMQNEEDMNRADRYWKMYDGGYEAGLSSKVGGLLGNMFDVYSGRSEAVELPELPREEKSLRDLAIKDEITGESWI